MIKYDTIIACPSCDSQHDTDEWNETTEEDFGPGILPIELGNTEPDVSYTCPTCWAVVPYGDLVVLK